MAYVDESNEPEQIEVASIARLYGSWRARYVDRDQRWMRMDAVVRGEYDAVDPEEDPLESKSPNLIQVALEDTAEAASLMPTLRVKPMKNGPTAKETAARMERVGSSYFDASRMDFIVNETIMDLAAFGLSPWCVWPDTDQKMPIIEKRDPRFCYPEPGYRPGEVVRRCLFAREMYFTQLTETDQAKIRVEIDDSVEDSDNTKVVVVEYMCDTEIVVAALYQNGAQLPTGTTNTYTPVELDRIPVTKCPVVIGTRFSLDGESRGQFDQVVGVLLAHVRLMAMVQDYADQAVYSDIWVKDLIGEMPYGGGAYIELGPQGAIGRVPPAVNALNIRDDLQQLVDAIHLGGRWPKSRPGEIDQAIASAKFLEATAGMMNTAIKTYHQLLKRMMEQALRLCFITDKHYFPGTKVASGVLRNQEFIEEYTASKDIDLANQVRVEYGLGLGRDPSQSAVLLLQYANGDNPFISREFVMENIEGVSDVARERSRIDVEQLTSIMKAKLLQLVQAGQIDDKHLVAIAQERADGKDLIALYKKYIVDVATEAAAGQSGSGIGPPVTPGLPGPGPGGPGGPMGPGGPGGPPPPPGGPAPPGQGATPSPPAPPAIPQLLSRLGVPAGPGGLLGSEIKR